MTKQDERADDDKRARPLVGKTEAATRVANGWSVKNDLVPSR